MNSGMSGTPLKTSVVKNNGFNPSWEETLLLPFEVLGGMKELVFLRVEVKDERGGMSVPGMGGDGLCGVWCAGLGSVGEGLVLFFPG